MATLLYRLGRFSFRRAWTVIAVWFVILVGILGGSIALGGTTQESFAIPGTESQQALDRLNAVFPEVGGATVQVVTVAPDGASVTDPAYTAAIKKQVSAIEDLDGISAVVSPFSEYAGNAVSADKSMAIIRVQFKGVSTDVTDTMLDNLVATQSITEDAGMNVEFGGQVFQDNTFGITITEVFGVIFAALVLFITFGSLLSAGMPLFSALIGVGIVVGTISTISAFTSVSSTAPMLALMIGLAVGIDYALFILSRHRTQLARGEDPEESAAMAVGTAGSAVVFAGVTVIIALLGLLVVGIPFLSTMGVGAAFAVLIAIGIATTLVPALFGLAGKRLAPKAGSRAERRALAHDGDRKTMGMRWVTGVMRVPVVAVVGVIAILGTLAIPALSLQVSLPDNGSEPAASTQRLAYDLVSEGFGEGYNGPLIVAVDITQTVTFMDDLEKIRTQLEKLDGVDYVSKGIPNPSGVDTAILQVIPTTSPDSPKTQTLVQEIRDLAPSIEKKYNTPIFVTGATAVAIDISTRLSGALLPFGLIVVGLSIVLLMMVFRSVLVPLKAAIGFLLSVASSFGVVVAIFQWGWFADLLHVETPGPIISFLPILLMAVLFGLAMDYELFLVSGMREEYVKTGDAKFAVAHGFANGARVVTAAALIMFFVFFAFVPEGSGAIQPIALGLAVGIAIDAFLVRMTLVPAIMTLLGNAAWWMPRWLAKLLPNVDVEGEQLREHRDDVEWARGETGAIISTVDLVAGSREQRVGPMTLAIGAGTLVVASGDPVERRLLAATLAGRLSPLSGRAQVAGHPLPSEAARVAALVAIADVGGSQRAESSVTVGELLTERLQFTQPWYRSFTTARSSRTWLERINAITEQVTDGATTWVSAASTLRELPQRERAITLAALALAERAPVVMLDQLDAFAYPEDEAAFLRALDQLAPASTTIIVGTPVPVRALASVQAGLRPIVVLDLYHDTPQAVESRPAHYVATRATASTPELEKGDLR
ncbi:MAG: MMPL family transporter [Microbacteriaceae bacterium]